MSPVQPSSTIEHLDEGSFSEKVLNSAVPVLVDFYADWCGPCRAMAPALEELASETAGIRVVKVNVDEAPEVASRYGISAIPSLLVFKNGEVVAEHVGLASKAALKSLVRR